MKTVILAGGEGTRLAEYTVAIPKPMVEIRDRPILGHIVDIYQSQGFGNFVIACGYKGGHIAKWVEDNLKTSGNVQVIQTGEKTKTGGRIKRVQSHLTSTFMMTYGDGVADVDLNHLLNYHKSMQPLVTLTAVRPPARFGSLRLDGAGKVMGFHEKSQTMEGWVNGGFMVVEPSVVNMIKGDDTNFEKEVLPEIAEDGKLMAYYHTGFWQCMDTLRDVKLLRRLAKEGPPWIGKSAK
jgi:glucose-1-phosphate cytidylyltransferase